MLHFLSGGLSKAMRGEVSCRMPGEIWAELWRTSRSLLRKGRGRDLRVEGTVRRKAWRGEGTAREGNAKDITSVRRGWGRNQAGSGRRRPWTAKREKVLVDDGVLFRMSVLTRRWVAERKRGDRGRGHQVRDDGLGRSPGRPLCG